MRDKAQKEMWPGKEWSKCAIFLVISLAKYKGKYGGRLQRSSRNEWVLNLEGGEVQKAALY